MSIVDTIKNAVRFVKALLTPGVPIGRTAFDAWSEVIIKLSGLPDNVSIRFTLATVVLQTDTIKVSSKSKFYFVRMLRGAANKQIASVIFQEIKQQEAAAQAAAKSQTAEATGPTLVASSGPQQ